jgi:hypothetical protein
MCGYYDVYSWDNGGMRGVVGVKGFLCVSERRDLNPRPPLPQSGALPSCATPRNQLHHHNANPSLAAAPTFTYTVIHSRYEFELAWIPQGWKMW